MNTAAVNPRITDTPPPPPFWPPSCAPGSLSAASHILTSPTVPSPSTTSQGRPRPRAEDGSKSRSSRGGGRGGSGRAPHATKGGGASRKDAYYKPGSPSAWKRDPGGVFLHLSEPQFPLEKNEITKRMSPPAPARPPHSLPPGKDSRESTFTALLPTSEPEPTLRSEVLERNRVRILAPLLTR